MRHFIIAVACALALGVVSYSSSASTPLVRQVETYQGKTALEWHHLAVERRVQRDRVSQKLTSHIRLSKRLQRQLRRESREDTVLTSPGEAAMLCIHGGEGSWTDSGAPYYGGMQMDLGFQQTYGMWAYKKWGTADHWPVSVQIAVALYAQTTRGYYPWPNTARDCGLL